MAASLGGSLVFVALLSAGLLAPGWLLARAMKTRADFAAVFLGSCALLMNVVLALDACGVRLTMGNTSAAIAALCLVLVVVAQLRGSASFSPRTSPRVTSDAPRPDPLRRRGLHRLLLVAVAIGLGAIIVRVSLDPLSGYDHTFRWDFLAQQIVREASLQFYPPFNADDFLHYGWCDGIAPLVSSLYFWAYGSAGNIAGWATTPIVLAQAFLLFRVVYELAALRTTPTAGYFACAVLATSAVSLWGIAMGQETGFTALSLVAMFLFIEKHHANSNHGWLIWAGIAAGTGALAREYGLAFAVFGAGALAIHRTKWRGWIEFAAAATVVATPWYLRNWLKTGHPFYSHDFGGLFPHNEVATEYLRIVSEFYGLTNRAGVVSLLAGLVLILCGIPLFVAAVAGIVRRRETGPWLLALVGVIMLWLWSVGQTSGGAAYSLRVLTPAIALGAVLAGRWLGLVGDMRHRWGIAAMLLIVTIDAGARSLYLPALPKVAWWRQPALLWRDISQHAAQTRRSERIWPDLADAAGPRKILISDPVFHALLVQHGAKPVPFFSPAVRFLFASDARFDDCIARLRADEVRFIVIVRNNQFIDAQMARHPFFRALSASTPTQQTSAYAVYDLYAAPLVSLSAHAR
jgi:hypothetical protein